MRGEQQLLAAPRLDALVACVMLVITASVFAAVADHAMLIRIQRLDDAWLQQMISGRSAPLTATAKVFNLLGLAYVTLPARIAVVCLLAVRRRWWHLAAFAVAVVVSEVLIGLLKGIYDRARPPGSLVVTSGASFPSGHSVAASVTVVAAVIALVPAGRRRVWWSLAAGAFSILMAVSRAYLGAHWLSDASAGILLGTSCALLAALVVDQFQRRPQGRRPQRLARIQGSAALHCTGLRGRPPGTAMNTEPARQDDKLTAANTSPPSLSPQAPSHSTARNRKHSLAAVLADPRARLRAGTAVMLVTAMAARRSHVSQCEARAFRAVNGLPDSLYLPAWVVMQLGTLGAAPAAASTAWLAGDRKLAGRLLAGGIGTWAVSKLVKRIVRRPRPAFLLPGARCRGRHAAGFGYLSGHAGVAVALGAAALPHLGPAGRALALSTAPVVGLTRVYTGAHLPLDIAGGAALGLAVDAAVALVREMAAPPLTTGEAADVIHEQDLPPPRPRDGADG